MRFFLCFIILFTKIARPSTVVYFCKIYIFSKVSYICIVIGFCEVIYGCKITTLLKGKCNKENNQTVVIITHDEKIALSADRVITIEDGQITRDSKKEGVMAS